MSRMPTFRLSGLVSLRRKSYVPEAPCNCGCWKPCVSTDVTIPRYTPLYGLATISGMRLQVTVSSVEYGGRIFAVEAVAYDLDGQPGLNVPNSRERTALKEALASVGQTAGTSVNVTRSAGQQVLSELARGGLQASSQYVAGKLREVKITLKANHQLLLISKE